jgi:hypothetical protein
VSGIDEPGPAEAPAPAASVSASVTRADLAAPLLMTIGAVLAIVGATLRWASYIVRADAPDPDSLTQQQPESLAVPYGGLVLFEGRIVLILGVAVVVLAAVSARLAASGRFDVRRPVGIALAAIGFAIVAVTLSAAFGRPATIATFTENVQAFDTTTEVPTGPGVWVGFVAGLVVLAAALVSWLGPRELLARLRGGEQEWGNTPEATFVEPDETYPQHSDRVRL